MLDLMIRNACLLGHSGRYDVGIADGVIQEVAPSLRTSGQEEIDAAGKLLSPGFVDAHLHLDKGMICDEYKHGVTDLPDMILKMREFKQGATVENVRDRVLRGIAQAVRRGTTALRTNVEADPFFEYRAVEGVRLAVAEAKDLIDVQTIAFPQDGWFRTEGTLEAGCEPYIEESLRRGIDLVGGNVNQALWPSDPREQIDRIFTLAKRYDRGIDVHVDNSDNPAAFALPYLAQKTLREDYEGRVTVGHIASLARVPDDVAARTIRQVQQAGIHVGVCPTRIAVTRVKQLLDAGVNVFIGTDEVMGMYTRSGVADVLMVMWLLSLVTHLSTDADYEEIFKMGTYNGARAMGLSDYGLVKGKAADLVLLDGTSPAEVICYHARRLLVLKRGRIVARDGTLVAKLVPA